MKKNERARGPQVTVFHNPGPKWTLGLPGERANMKTKKKNSKGKGSQALVKKNHFSKSAAPAKTTKKKNGFQQKSFFRGLRNPLSKFTRIGGVSVVEIAVGGVATLLVQGITPLLPGAAGSWVRIISQAGVVIGLVYIAPSSMKTPVAIGGGAVPAVGIINKLTNNAIENAFAGLDTYLQPVPPPVTGVHGMGDMSGLYAVPPGFARYDY